MSISTYASMSDPPPKKKAKTKEKKLCNSEREKTTSVATYL